MLTGWVVETACANAIYSCTIHASWVLMSVHKPTQIHSSGQNGPWTRGAATDTNASMDDGSDAGPAHFTTHAAQEHFLLFS